MKQHTVDKAIAEYEKIIRDPKGRKAIKLTKDWADSASSEPGVYAIYKGKTLLYVGESGKLSGRLNDLRFTRNHSFRRSFGKSCFPKMKGVNDASSSSRFPNLVEVKVDAQMEKLKISVLPILFGRKEFEEYMIERTSKQRPLFNTKGQRDS